MRAPIVVAACLAALLGACQPQAAPPAASPAAPASAAAAYEPVAIEAEDQPGTTRHVRCQIGDRPEQDCTLTPLFGDESFQLDGADVALRMVVADNEGSLFEVFGPTERVPVGLTYRRASPADPCWVGAGDSTPAKVCVR